MCIKGGVDPLPASLILGQGKKQTKQMNDMKKPIEIPEWMEQIVTEAQGLFEPLSGIPPENRIKHTIQLVPGARLVMKRPYRLSEVQKKHAEDQLRAALTESWIQPPKSPWGTAILMVPKKDNSWRLCADY